MLLTCPHCGTRYIVHPEEWPAQQAAADGTRAPHTRKVRCKKCQTVWRATPTEEDEAPENPESSETPEEAPIPVVEEEETAPGHPEREEREETPPARAAGRIRAFLIATPLLLLLVAGTAFYTATDGLKSLSLPSFSEVRLPTLPALDLSWIRLPDVDSSALKVEASHWPEKLGDGQLGWQIRVTLENPTTSALEIPPIELRIVDAQGRTLSRWTVRPRKRQLQPRETWAFETTRVAPPAGGRKLVARTSPPALARP